MSFTNNPHADRTSRSFARFFTLRLYRDDNREWRWQLISRVRGKNRVIGASIEGYKTRAGAAQNCYSVTGCYLADYLHTRRGGIIISVIANPPYRH